MQTIILTMLSLLPLQDAEVTKTHVAGPVHMLVGQGGNVGASIGEDGALIVDDQFDHMAPKIQAALGDAELKFVVNTHWHFDHVGGNVVFGPLAPILAHDNVRERLVNGGRTDFGEVPPAPDEALPVVTYDDSVSLHFNGEEIRLMHVPHSHTDGDTVVFFTGSNVVHMGDTFFSGSFPYVDVGSGGSVTGLAQNIAEIIARLPDDVKIIPGHGPLSTLDDLRAYKAMLIETTAIVRERMEQGLGSDAVVAAGLPDEWASWGGGFIDTERWLGIVHDSLEREANGR